MPKVRAILPHVSAYPRTRPSQCPYCGCGILHKHGEVPKRMRGVCDTNNVTERAIGKSKIRYKTMRDYKSVEGMMNGLWLTQRVWGESGIGIGDPLVA